MAMSQKRNNYCNAYNKFLPILESISNIKNIYNILLKLSGYCNSKIYLFGIFGSYAIVYSIVRMNTYDSFCSLSFTGMLNKL